MSSLSPRFRSLARAIISFAAAAFGIVTCAADELPPASTRTVDYRRDVQPVLARNCYGCHGPQKQKGGLRLDRKTEALAGGDSGPSVRAGQERGEPARSVRRGPRPGHGHAARRETGSLPEQVGLLRAWIDQGAAWPEESERSGPVRARAGRITGPSGP